MKFKERNAVETKAKVKNGMKRLFFVTIALLLEIVILVILFTKLNNHATWINVVIRIIAIILVLVIYSMHKTSTMKMPWVVLIASLPVFGVAFYLMVGMNGGTKRMRKRYQAVDDVLLPHLPENADVQEQEKMVFPAAATISSYIYSRSDYPVYQNTDVTYYSDAAKALEAQLKDLAQAEKFIFMEYYAIEDKEAWKMVEDVLAERAAHGVEVRVFYDDLGSIGFITTDFAQKLERRGIACRVFNPFMPGLNLFLNNRDHRKITVVDGKVAYTGGYNLANEYFNMTHPYGRWKDSGIRLEGDAVRSFTVAFLEMWNAVKDRAKKGGIRKELSNYLIDYDYEAKQHGFIQPYADQPMDDEQIGEDVYISIINKANEYCYFMTPYLILTDEMIHALSLAAKRGVDVRIITPGIPDKKIVYSVTRSFYNSLVRNGVRIFEWTPGFCHAKLCVADGVMSTCGTINLDYRSLYHHFEIGCFMVDRVIANLIKADFDETLAECQEVTEYYKDGRKAHLRLGQLFLRLFAELL
jgi:cardiolipin synthase A/B